jgi:hypothetical protein
MLQKKNHKGDFWKARIVLRRLGERLGFGKSFDSFLDDF